MNEESKHHPIEPELEARIVALVLGEASDFESDELNRLIAGRPELAAFKLSMQQLHGMLDKIGQGEFEAACKDWKLPSDKRNAVLTAIRGAAPLQQPTAQQPAVQQPTVQQPAVQHQSVDIAGAKSAAASQPSGVTKTPPIKQNWKWNFGHVAVAVCVLGFMGILALPSFIDEQRFASDANMATPNSEITLPAIAMAGDDIDQNVSVDEVMNGTANTTNGFGFEPQSSDLKLSLSAIEDSVKSHLNPQSEDIISQDAQLITEAAKGKRQSSSQNDSGVLEPNVFFDDEIDHRNTTGAVVEMPQLIAQNEMRWGSNDSFGTGLPGQTFGGSLGPIDRFHQMPELSDQSVDNSDRLGSRAKNSQDKAIPSEIKLQTEMFAFPVLDDAETVASVQQGSTPSSSMPNLAGTESTDATTWMFKGSPVDSSSKNQTELGFEVAGNAGTLRARGRLNQPHLPSEASDKIDQLKQQKLHRDEAGNGLIDVDFDLNLGDTRRPATKQNSAVTYGETDAKLNRGFSKESGVAGLAESENRPSIRSIRTNESGAETGGEMQPAVPQAKPTGKDTRFDVLSTREPDLDLQKALEATTLAGQEIEPRNMLIGKKIQGVNPSRLAGEHDEQAPDSVRGLKMKAYKEMAPLLLQESVLKRELGEGHPKLKALQEELNLTREFLEDQSARQSARQGAERSDVHAKEIIGGNQQSDSYATKEVAELESRKPDSATDRSSNLEESVTLPLRDYGLPKTDGVTELSWRRDDVRAIELQVEKEDSVASHSDGEDAHPFGPALGRFGNSRMNSSGEITGPSSGLLNDKLKAEGIVTESEKLEASEGFQSRSKNDLAQINAMTQQNIAAFSAQQPSESTAGLGVTAADEPVGGLEFTGRADVNLWMELPSQSKQQPLKRSLISKGMTETEEGNLRYRYAVPDLTNDLSLLKQRTLGAPAKSQSKPTEIKQQKVQNRSLASEGLNETLAATDAFSTFSLHVSDVSFKLAKAALAKGEWPEAAKIRIEEFVNAFDYADPMPRTGEKVACVVEQSIHPFLQQRNLLRVSMRTAAAGRSSSTPLRLTLLLDNSGSMERIDRQQTVRRAFSLLAKQLKPIDHVTLISFARQPRLLADKVSGDKANQLVEMIDSLPSEGGTNIEAALQLAFDKAKEHQSPGAQNRIVLLTDGAVNLGNASPESLSEMVTMMRTKGIAFDAAGISSEGLNDEVLEALTRQGDGRYYLLDSVESADSGFAAQIAGALRPSAKNVKVQVEFNPKRVGKYKLLGFENHRLKKEDFRTDKVDAAEMAAAEAGVAMYHFEALPDGEGDVGSVSVRFLDLSSGQMVEHRWPIPYEADTVRTDQATPSLRIAASAAFLAAKLRNESVGETVDLQMLSALVAGLPEAVRADDRIQSLDRMIRQARQLSGQ